MANLQVKGVPESLHRTIRAYAKRCGHSMLTRFQERRREEPMEQRQEQILRAAFLAGAITDALALIPMLFPSMAQLLWGFEDVTGPYRFAMGYGASLMAAWTALLLWAYRRPLERSFVAALTVFVIYGLVATEVVAVFAGHIPASRMIPTWLLQAGLLAVFAGGYHYPWLHQRLAAT